MSILDQLQADSMRQAIDHQKEMNQLQLRAQKAKLHRIELEAAAVEELLIHQRLIQKLIEAEQKDKTAKAISEASTAQIIDEHVKNHEDIVRFPKPEIQ